MAIWKAVVLAVQCHSAAGAQCDDAGGIQGKTNGYHARESRIELDLHLKTCMHACVHAG